jgi:hypothetical protein
LRERERERDIFCTLFTEVDGLTLLTDVGVASSCPTDVLYVFVFTVIWRLHSIF